MAQRLEQAKRHLEQVCEVMEDMLVRVHLAAPEKAQDDFRRIAAYAQEEGTGALREPLHDVEEAANEAAREIGYLFDEGTAHDEHGDASEEAEGLIALQIGDLEGMIADLEIDPDDLPQAPPPGPSPQTIWARMEDSRAARMMRELQSELSALVVSGDLTPEEANEWANAKADQWAQGLS